MRIFLLPLTTRQALVYCQRITPKPAAQRSLFDKVSIKATETWAKWEQAEKGWQKQVVTYGNRALQRIPYQEWGLKSFPSTNPNLQAKQITDERVFDVIYPDNVMDAQDVPKVLGRLARERKQLHSNRFWGSAFALPFTIPFALIPVIPNIPFFYVAYRCWSHWKALKGSDHLDFVLDHRLFRPIPDQTLEKLYEQFSTKPLRNFEFLTASQVEAGEAQKEQQLLPAGSHVEISKQLEVPELSGEIERAVWQVERAFKKEEKEKQTQKKLVSQQLPADEKVDEKLSRK